MNRICAPRRSPHHAQAVTQNGGYRTSSATQCKLQRVTGENGGSSPPADYVRLPQEGYSTGPARRRSSYVVAVLRGTRRLLLVSGLFRGPMLARCFAYYVDYAFAAVDPDLVTGVPSYRRVAAADDGGMPSSTGCEIG